MARPPRPHPLARSALVDRLNGWLESAWESGIASRPSLDPEILWRKGARGRDPHGELAGRSEEDAADFRLRLERLAGSLVNEAALNPLGLTMAHGQLVRAIRHRFQLGELWGKQPGLAERPSARPIIIVGHMRSGTTRLHRLLAADPAHAATRFCDSWNPVPRWPDTRPFVSALALAFAHRLDPWLDTLHPFGATHPDEELGWLSAALDHCAFEAQWHMPAYVAFSEARDAAPVYREFARLLATDANWHGNAHLPRVMKVPQFAEDLPSLLAQFPHARVIATRRPTREVKDSSVSLVANQRAIQSDSANLPAIDGECARKIALRQRRMDTALAEFTGPLAKVDFIELEQDWEAAIRRVYGDLGLRLSTAALASMRREMRRAENSPHGSHRETYEAFARA